ncbi:hypothetical protein T440DRAFT_392824 [Plenodomus tracheiphilus IPT5]|uniref:Uncharacterized protein n=1 Tax=Plenodomus tracheiphilus IPT5 TaxID=1408161 RepID=A0A6A7B9Y5_9PLEO|nr:hypothetical protein T440DRAFT_392824 [Plenodomus tracheiphilus IPT5]
MLSYSNRQNFERIRAQWETAQSGEDNADSMVGRREKHAAPQPAPSETQENGASKFRRKLSYGLAFISNPLSQRKTTPGRHTVSVPSLAATEPATSDAASTNGGVQEDDGSLSPTPAIRQIACSDDTSTRTTTPAHDTGPADRAVNDTTPRPLPRSRTLSYIPRPVFLQALATNNVDMKASVKSVTSASTADLKSNAPPSKIPTPSPPLSEPRGSSPRRYLSPHTSQQLKHISSAQAFEARSYGTLAQSAMRARTTPNLVNVTNSQQPASVAVPMKSALKRAAVSSVAEKPILQENVSDNRRIAQRRSRIQERPSRHESLAVLDTIPNRRSFGPAWSAQSKQLDYATPPADRIHSSVSSAQHTPVTVKRFQPKMQTTTPPESDIVHVTSNSSFSQSRLLGPKDPPTPTPSIDSLKPTLPMSATRNDLGRKRLGTPNGLAGVWRSSRALAATNHEVRQLPRSSTFHSLGRKEAPPPLPPIPEKYRAASLTHLTKHQHLHMKSEMKEPLPAAKGDVSNAASAASTLEVADDNRYRFSTDSAPTSRNRYSSSATERSDTSSVFVARPSRPPPPGTPANQRSLSTVNLESHSSGASRRRPWSIPGDSHLSNADVDPILQVKDYMPPLYWAGRFQSRFDQWRTEAMLAQLNPDHVRTGPMSECNIDQEKLASCYIFGQLRDLCTSNQAADSLWEFEYRYRKDNKLLGNPLDHPAIPLSRKQDDKTLTHQGAFGRAVRKLTPRKSSLVNLRNLLKGKGKSEDGRGGIMSEGDPDTSSGES